jgi:alkylhydroperoxidase/carboxymuconolactone decarboxylase family protein YurZ
MNDEMRERGLEIRRQVLGDAYVAQAEARVDEFTRPFQDLLNAYCWGEVWGRPGLPRKVRSLVNGDADRARRPEELRLHLRGACATAPRGRRSARCSSGRDLLRNSAANAAFREARQVLAEIEAERPADQPQALAAE